MPGISIFLAGIVVLILPGFTMLILTGRQKMDLAENIAVSIGLSISITTVIFLLTVYLPIKITFPLLIILYLICAITCGLVIFIRKTKFRWTWEIPITLMLLTAVLLLRFYQIKDLVLPAWVDSVHHVLITRIILENGKIPTTLNPYLPVPFAYYFGFHGMAAVVSELSGLSPERSVLVLGQILNACIPLAIFRLGCSIWNDRKKALIAALLVAFVSQMPAYYVTWGRYTLLTGMLMLAITMAEFIDTYRNQTAFGKYVILFLLLFGLTLSHYFSALLFIIFAVTYILNDFFGMGRHLTAAKLKVLLVIFLTFLFLTPWLVRAYALTGYSLNLDLHLLTTDVDRAYIQKYSRYLFDLAGPVRNYVFLLIGILGLIPTMIDKRSRSLAIWTVLILISALPLGLKLPNIRPDHMVIILFFPLSFCAASLLHFLWSLTNKYLPRNKIFVSVTALPLLAFIGWGIVDTSSIIKPETVLATQSDSTAIQWIKSNVDPGARFLINSTYWQSSIYRGVDGGFWILPLTERYTIPPPIIYIWGREEYSQSIAVLSKRISEINSCDEAFWKVISAGSLTHIYLKDGLGALQPNALLNCSGIDRIYFRDGISIFQVDPKNH